MIWQELGKRRQILLQEKTSRLVLLSGHPKISHVGNSFPHGEAPEKDILSASVEMPPAML